MELLWPYVTSVHHPLTYCHWLVLFAAAGPLGSSDLEAATAAAAAVAAGATREELLGLFLYCCRLLEATLVVGAVSRSSNEQEYMLLTSHAR